MIKFLQKTKSNKGYSLMELVVSISILATLAAVSVPTFIETGNNAKGTKSMDNINNIGVALLNSYNRIVAEGYYPATGTSSAIAVFNVELSEAPMADADIVVNYASAGQITWVSIFPDQIPVSPFNNEPYLVTVNQAGGGTWQVNGGTVTLTITSKPSITIKDPAQPDIVMTFTP